MSRLWETSCSVENNRLQGRVKSLPIQASSVSAPVVIFPHAQIALGKVLIHHIFPSYELINKTFITKSWLAQNEFLHSYTH